VRATITSTCAGCIFFAPRMLRKDSVVVDKPILRCIIPNRFAGGGNVFRKDKAGGTLPEGYVITWIAVGLGLVIGIGFLLLIFAIPYLLAPRRPSKEKAITYECGMDPSPPVWSQLNARYYIFAILFLIFDIEAVFLFPWAVVFLGSKIAFYAMLIFLAVLFFAVVYAWRKGVLQWHR